MQVYLFQEREHVLRLFAENDRLKVCLSTLFTELIGSKQEKKQTWKIDKKQIER